jgi:hypothetical protein
MRPATGAHPRRCRAITAADRPATKASSTRPTRQPLRRSSLLSVPPATEQTGNASALWSFCCGAPDCGSAKHSICTRATLTLRAARSSYGTARAANAARLEWTYGHGSNSSLGLRRAGTCRSARCCVCFMAARRVVAGKPQRRGSNCTTPQPRPVSGDGSHPINPARTRDRDGPRRRPTSRNPASTRTRTPRHHLDLSPRDRQRRDREHRPRTTVADDLRNRRTRNHGVIHPYVGSIVTQRPARHTSLAKLRALAGRAACPAFGRARSCDRHLPIACSDPRRPARATAPAAAIGSAAIRSSEPAKARWAPPLI